MMYKHIDNAKIFLIWRPKNKSPFFMKNAIMSLLEGNSKKLFIFTLVLLSPVTLLAAGESIPSIGPIRFEFIIFGLILLGVALFHKQTFWVAVIGLAVLLTFKFVFDPAFHLGNTCSELRHLVNSLWTRSCARENGGSYLIFSDCCLVLPVLSKIFEESRVPEILPRYLPDDWKGPFLLLVFVFILSSFLDNIAAALIGGTIALVVFKKKVHIGYIAALVAASNAGGSGSVVGDTTTTMMWIDGVYAFNVLHAYVAAVVALLFFAWFAAHQQDKFQKIQKDAEC